LKQEVYAFRSSAQGAGISARFAGLEQLVKEKDDALNRMNDLVQETRQAKSLLESNMEVLRNQLASVQSEHANQHNEMQKLHDMIKKLQEDLRTAKSKVRSSSTLAQEKDRLRQEAQSQYDSVKRDLAELRNNYDKKLKEIGELEEAKRSILQELEEARHLNEGNERVIAWLHQQISDDRLNHIIEHGGNEENNSFDDKRRATVNEQTGSTAAARPAANTESSNEPQSMASSNDLQLAMNREARMVLANDWELPIEPDTSVPRFTSEELAGKQKEDDSFMV
jgi:chromosome segregation ATPase